MVLSSRGAGIGFGVCATACWLARLKTRDNPLDADLRSERPRRSANAAVLRGEMPPSVARSHPSATFGAAAAVDDGGGGGGGGGKAESILIWVAKMVVGFNCGGGGRGSGGSSGGEVTKFETVLTAGSGVEACVASMMLLAAPESSK